MGFDTEETSVQAGRFERRPCIRPDPEGSHLFPEDVILEEACQHLDRIWDSQWQGVADDTGDVDSAQGGQEEAQQRMQSREKMPAEGTPGGVPQFFRNLGQKLRIFKKRHGSDKDTEVQSRIDSTMTFRVPRYPSWAQWDEEKR